MMTPEGKVKKLVSSYLEDLAEKLDSLGLEMYTTMVVPVGYGKRNSLDYLLCLAGHLVAIETKAPDGDLTPNQRLTVRNLLNSGATVFVISGMDGLNALKAWVKRNENWIFDHRCYRRDEGDLPRRAAHRRQAYA